MYGNGLPGLKALPREMSPFWLMSCRVYCAELLIVGNSADAAALRSALLSHSRSDATRTSRLTSEARSMSELSFGSLNWRHHLASRLRGSGPSSGGGGSGLPEEGLLRQLRIGRVEIWTDAAAAERSQESQDCGSARKSTGDLAHLQCAPARPPPPLLGESNRMQNGATAMEIMPETRNTSA